MRYLLRDFLAQSQYRRFQSASTGELAAALAAPVAIAYWIQKFHPELAQRPSLRLVVLGAEWQDSQDDGCWYSVIPWLLGNDDLKISAVLVGPELRNHPELQGLPKTSFGTFSTSPGRLNRDLAPATLVPALVSSFLASAEGRAPVDLFFMLNPGLEVLDKDSWLDVGQLDAVAARGAPIGVTAFCDVEYIGDRWISELFGFTAGPQVLVNPYRGEDTPAGAWGHTLWELEGRGPAADHHPDNDAVEQFEMYNSTIGAYCRHRGPPSLEMGRLIEDIRSWDHALIGPAVRLPDPRLVVQMSTGEVHALTQEGRHNELTGAVVPAELVSSYPRDEPYGFKHLLWTAEVLNSLVDLTEESETGERGQMPGLGELLETAAALAEIKRALAPAGSRDEDDDEDDDRLFPMSAAEMDAGLKSFLQMTTGQDVDPEEFMRSMRISGGVHGPSHPGWYDLLTTLGWELVDYLDEPDRFEAAFFTRSTRESRMFPVVCESYSYTPGDIDDELVVEAKAKITKKYPRGALLVFKAMMFKDVEGERYSFAGLVYRKEQWRPFALAVGMSDVDAVLAQQDAGFSFNNPSNTPGYADKGGQLARALNFMTHGADPNGAQKAVVLRSGDWSSPLPA